MKKTTLSVFLMITSLFAIAKGGRTSENATHSGKHIGRSTAQVGPLMRVTPQTNQTNAAFYSEDFSGGGIPATWTNVDGSGAGVTWVFTTTGSVNQPDALEPVGTSAGNGYIKFDSDSAGGSLGGEDGILTTDAIDCSGQTNVHFSCNEFFRQYVAATAVISVSNDGTTWTEIHHAETGLAQNEATLNPNVVDVDISAIADNQATVYIRFEFIGDWDYYWFVDDIKLFTPSQIDGGATEVALDFNGCSLSPTTPISILVKNFGIDPISNFPVSYVVNGGTPVTETFTATLNSGDTATYTFTTTADLSAAAVYQVDVYTDITGDGDTTNDGSNNVTASFDHIDLTAGYAMGFEAGEDLTAYTIEDNDGDGVTFDISPDYVHGGAACLRKPGSGVDDDNWLYTQCMDVVAGGTYTLTYYYKNFELANPCSLEVYMGAANTAAAMTELIIQNNVPGDTTYQMVTAPISVAPGTYYMGFHFYSTQGTGTSSLRIDDISIDFDDAVNENLVSSLISVYPNPSNGKINIMNRNTNERNFTVSVYNSLGSVVSTKQYQDLSNETIDLSNQPAGVYSVQLKSATTTVNKSVVISK